ncbi:MAG: TorF family putative porin [Desulfobulbaceae bacterium]
MNKTVTTTAVIAATMLMLGTNAPVFGAEEAEKPSGSMSVAMLSKYVWRGYELSKDSIVIQPSITASYMGFGINLWGNLDTDQDVDLFGEEGSNWNETDLTLSYGGKAGMVTYGAGYIYYGLEGIDDTQELYGSIGLDTLLAPTLTVYRDIDAYAGWYTTLGVSHSFQVSESMSLALAGQVSYLSADDAETIADPDDPGSAYSDFHDGKLSATLNIPITEEISVAPNVSYSFALSSESSDTIKAASASGEDDDFIFGGITLNMAL